MTIPHSGGNASSRVLTVSLALGRSFSMLATLCPHYSKDFSWIYSVTLTTAPQGRHLSIAPLTAEGWAVVASAGAGCAAAVAASCVAVGVAVAPGVDGVGEARGHVLCLWCHPRGGCSWALPPTSGLLEKPRAAREGLPLPAGAAGRPGTPCRSRCARLQLAPAPGLSSLSFLFGPF